MKTITSTEFKAKLEAMVERAESLASSSSPAPCSSIVVDGRTFATPTHAAMHLLWLLQRLSYYEPEREGMPADGPRFREGIIEARKLLKMVSYEPRAAPWTNDQSLATAGAGLPQP